MSYGVNFMGEQRVIVSAIAFKTPTPSVAVRRFMGLCTTLLTSLEVKRTSRDDKRHVMLYDVVMWL